MKTPKKILRCVVLHLFFYFLCIGNCILCASSVQENDKKDDSNWSFEFNDCSISDCLNQISKVTGISVFIDKDIDKMIPDKSYEDKSIDDMVMDILSRENYALIRQFNGKKRLVSISVWMLYGTNNGNNSSPAMFPSKRGKKHGNPVANRNLSKANHVERNIKKSNKNNPLAIQGESKVYSYSSKINIKSKYNKPLAGDTSYYQEDRISKDGINKNLDQGSTPISSVLPPKPTQSPSYERNDLEPPPMPPGF